MTFQEKIHKLRKDNHMTQDDLAQRLNVSRQTISKWENGISYPDIDNILELCKVFNISSDSLLNYQSKFNVKKRFKVNWLYGIVFIISLTIIIFLLIFKKFDETSSVIKINAYGLIFIALIALCVISVKSYLKNK